MSKLKDSWENFISQFSKRDAGEALAEHIKQHGSPTLGKRLFGWTSAVPDFLRSLVPGITSLFDRWTGAHLTGAEREANAFTASQTQQQMDFQERMANTQWQRGVQDMQSAGVNPALAYSQGGAVAPSGASGSSVSPGAGMSMSELVQLMLLKPQKRLLEEEARKTYKEGEKAAADADKTRKDTSWIDTMNDATVKQLHAATRVAISEADLNENERKALLIAEKVLTDNRSDLTTVQYVYEKWRTDFIKDTGMDPSASALSQLFQNSITHLAKALQGLFDFHFNFTDLHLPGLGDNGGSR